MSRNIIFHQSFGHDLPQDDTVLSSFLSVDKFFEVRVLPSKKVRGFFIFPISVGPGVRALRRMKENSLYKKAV